MKQILFSNRKSCSLPIERQYFSKNDIRNMMIPLFFEQLLVILVGIADTFMISYAGDAAVSGVSLVNMFNTIFIYLFTALASGGAIIVSQYLGSGCMLAGGTYYPWSCNPEDVWSAIQQDHVNYFFPGRRSRSAWIYFMGTN